MWTPPKVGDRVVKQPRTGHACGWDFADRGVVTDSAHVKPWYMVRWDGYVYPVMVEACDVVRAADLGERYTKPHGV